MSQSSKESIQSKISIKAIVIIAVITIGYQIAVNEFGNL